MIWDGKSAGTLLNVLRLLSLQKKAVIYTVPEKRFLEFRSVAEWEHFLATRDIELRHKIEERTKLEAVANRPVQTSLLR
jgi:adenine-specific DNA-methyltransferase